VSQSPETTKLTVEELREGPLPRGPEKNTDTTDRPIRDDVRRTVAAALARSLHRSKHPTP
jgi:hypothetical protein